MILEFGLLILLVLTIIYYSYQQKTEAFVSETQYSNLKTDPEKMNIIKSFFEKLTFVDNKYYLYGKEITCNVSEPNIIDEDTAV